MTIYLWGMGVALAASLAWGVVLWCGGMPLYRDDGYHRPPGGVVGLIGLAACLATVWPLLVPFALHALWRWLWKNAGPPGDHDPGQ